MDQNSFVDTSWDLGVWAADVADIPGVDEMPFGMRAVGMMLGPFVAEGEHFSDYDVDLLPDLPPAYPSVFGA